MSQPTDRFFVNVPKYSHPTSAATRVVLETTDLEEAKRRADLERAYSRFAIVSDARGVIRYTAPDPARAARSAMEGR